MVTSDLDGGRFNATGDVSFRGVTFRNVSFVGTSIEHLFARASTFVDCDFTGARLPYVDLGAGSGGRVHFVNCRFEETHFVDVFLGDARFERCSFLRVTLNKWRSECCEFVNNVFVGRLFECIFYGRPEGPCSRHTERPMNEFRGNDFRRVDLVETSFRRGIDIDQQLWPESKAYLRLDRMTERLSIARDTVSKWTDPGDRREALLVLDVLQVDANAGQAVLFARRDLFSDLPEVLQARIWKALEDAIPRMH